MDRVNDRRPVTIVAGEDDSGALLLPACPEGWIVPYVDAFQSTPATIRALRALHAALQARQQLGVLRHAAPKLHTSYPTLSRVVGRLTELGFMQIERTQEGWTASTSASELAR